MATIDLNAIPAQIQPTNFGNPTDTFQRIGRENFLIFDWSLARNSDPAVASESEPIFRGRSGGVYVYQTGSPPAGATDVVIVGFTTV